MRSLPLLIALAWCQQGPGSARVEQVLVEEQEYRGEFPAFEIRY